MNVFEDLLVDLKEENLLEDTILEERPNPTRFEPDNEPYIRKAESSMPSTEPAAVTLERNDAPPAAKPQATNSEFFKKRAVSEVSSLQMVEHVLTGVEREYLKIKPNAFDELNVKLALNKFIQLADTEAETDAHKAADVALMQETQAWCSALAERDKKIGVAHLRQYCENTRPALSSQALVSLCRFYRNLPYTEAIRSKYDFLITRLFSRALPNDERICLFTRAEAQKHLENLYREWSSVPLYSADDDDSKVMLTALSFDELAEESEQASSFDLLIESDFFSRLRMFKESIAELFFAPSVAIAAVEANVRIGNSYVKLIAAERHKMDANSIQAKYASLDHESFSDVTARTLELVDLLRSAPETLPPPEPAPEPRAERMEVSFNEAGARTREPEAKPDDAGASPSGFVGRMLQNAFAVNKWLLIGAVLIIGASVGLYAWANYFVEASVPSNGVRVVATDSSAIGEFVKTAKVSNQTFYGVLKENWDTLPKDKRTEYLQRVLAQGAELGFTQVSLITKDGKAAAYASKDRIDVQGP